MFSQLDKSFLIHGTVSDIEKWIRRDYEITGTWLLRNRVRDFFNTEGSTYLADYLSQVS